MKAYNLIMVAPKVENKSTGVPDPLTNHAHDNFDLLKKFSVDAKAALNHDGKLIGSVSTTLTLQNNWVDVNVAFPAKATRTGSIVLLEGSIKGGAVVSTTVIATLPVGFRPAYKRICPIWTSVNALGYLTVNPDGTIQATLTKAAGTLLDGVCFTAA